jgi:hypothetical protein
MDGHEDPASLTRGGVKSALFREGFTDARPHRLPKSNFEL